MDISIFMRVCVSVCPYVRVYTQEGLCLGNRPYIRSWYSYIGKTASSFKTHRSPGVSSLLLYPELTYQISQVNNSLCCLLGSL